MATFPYTPTRVLSSPTSNDIIYILQPGVTESDSSQLLALNTTRTLGSANLPYTTISPSLPFLNGTQNDSYTPAIDQEGNIWVYTGDCGDGAKGSSLWHFAPANEARRINGTWKEADLEVGALSSNNGLNGANYLASAIAFSSTVNASSDMYIFGGMCPTSKSSTADNWTQDADYSSTMLTIETSSSPTDVATYDLGISPSRGPPVAEAGFSITPLQPTFFDSGGKNGSQNQNFVLLGGHTQQAFINMSQVALFSLPEQSWTFLPVHSPSQEPNTELAARDQSNIDSRSGHSALLTSDGKRVVVFGGWVGDITNKANPQLAILELGEGYGGSGNWQWSIPTQNGPGLAPGSGIYGHGAAMLAGDVLMIVGGYQIPASGNSRNKRSSLSESTGTYYFNTTSNTWTAGYAHPVVGTAHGLSSSMDIKENKSSKKVGLGVGLTLGLLAVIAIILFYFWYGRRLKRRRNAREDELRHLASEPHALHLPGQSQNDISRQTGEMSAVDWGGENHGISRDSGAYAFGRTEPEAERTGLLFEIPSPTRGLRRSLHSRGTYQPTSRFDDTRRGPGFSTIHPIDERDEYDEDGTAHMSSGQHEMIQSDEYNVLTNVPVLDPFQDPMGGSRTPSPQSPQDRELEVRNWVSDWSAADAIMHSQVGWVSPEKTDRTSSTLSDQSARSGLSSRSIPRSVGTISRSISQRSAALFNAAPFRPTTPIDFQQSPTRRHGPEHRRAQSLTLHSSAQKSGTSDNHATFRAAVPHLRSEGEALLGDYSASGEPSPIRSQSRAKGWIGSVRRAFTGLERTASTSPENNASASSSPIKHNYTEEGLPRRAASTGAMLWQKRQGARDWDVRDKEGEGERGEANVAEGEDEEWDVESAVERRVVQVMFTVPKEKLRVVNRGPDGDGESLMSAEVKDAGEASEGHEMGTGKGKERE